MRIYALLALWVVLAGCAATPKRDLDLERLTLQWRGIVSEDGRRLAPGEAERVERLFERWRAMTTSDRAARAHMAYLVEQQINLYSAAVEGSRAERRLEELEDERKDLLLQLSQREARLAQREAERLRRAALAQAEEAERARMEVELQQQEAERLAQLLREEAAAAQRLAEARAREAELARREAELAGQEAISLREQLAGLRALPTDRGQVMVLGDVFFAPGQAELMPEARASLGPVLEFIDRYPGRPVSIEGHSDARGRPEANLRLSERRAASVRDALVALGADPARLSIRGLGSAQPIADNDSPEGRARNRRVEVIVEGAR